MRKTLLIAASALGASVISSQAGVYSQNIVGYVNAPYGVGYNNVAVPLDLSGGNTLTNIFPNPVAGGDGGPNGGDGPLDFTTVSVFNGTSFTVYTLDTDFASGVANGQDNAQVYPVPVVNPGTLIYFYNSGNSPGGAFTNTFVGTVHVDAAATGSQVVGSTTNYINVGNNFLASKLAIGGGISSVLNITNIVAGGDGPSAPNAGAGVLDFSTISIPNINGSGQFLGYSVTTFDTDFSTGFANGQDNAQVSEPQIPVGTGFVIFYENNDSTGTYLWQQAL